MEHGEADASPGEVTRLLKAWSDGESAALDQLVPLIYEELRRLAARYMSSERKGHTFTPTALVHESFLKLVQQHHIPDWQSRQHFFAVAARAMRQLLVDHARKRTAQKRNADLPDWEPLVELGTPAPWDVIDLDRALSRLEQLDPRKARATELRFFSGLSLEEIASLLEISAPTVHRELRMAEAWLASEIRGGK